MGPHLPLTKNPNCVYLSDCLLGTDWLTVNLSSRCTAEGNRIFFGVLGGWVVWPGGRVGGGVSHIPPPRAVDKHIPGAGGVAGCVAWCMTCPSPPAPHDVLRKAARMSVGHVRCSIRGGVDGGAKGHKAAGIWWWMSGTQWRGAGCAATIHLHTVPGRLWGEPPPHHHPPSTYRPSKLHQLNIKWEGLCGLQRVRTHTDTHTHC